VFEAMLSASAITFSFSSQSQGVLTMVEQQLQNFQHGSQLTHLLIAAIDTLINPQTITELSSVNNVYCDGNEYGQAPGEAAVCLQWEKSALTNSLVSLSPVVKIKDLKTHIQQSATSIDSVVVTHTQDHADTIAWFDLQLHKQPNIQTIKLFNTTGETGATAVLLAIVYASARLAYPFYNSHGVMIIENQGDTVVTSMVTQLSSHPKMENIHETRNQSSASSHPQLDSHRARDNNIEFSV
tara:strand:+ start:53159 stop:53878 length:720 start_codon:yes stop_codon:yes gene_type:complete